MMTPADRPPTAAQTTGMSTARLEAFSDAVLAVAATLLVLDIKTPDESGGESIWPVLGHQLPTLAAYITSFLTILIFWVNHHGLFHGARQVDRITLFVNGLLLLVVSFISYVTSVLGHALQTGDHDREAAVLYALTLAVASTCFSVLWRRAGRRPRQLGLGLAGPLLYVAAALVALLNAPTSLALDAATALYFAVLPQTNRNR
jgi:uncharacterized membrane protein